MDELRVAMFQCELAWERPQDNRRLISDMATTLSSPTDLIALPEMFTTGFSMNALANAEPPGGETQQWMQALAERHHCAVAGSIAVQDGSAVFNRLLFVTPEAVYSYDKRHLFRMAGEHQRYGAGERRVVVPWRGWRILLQVCYDLRFPVFSRNQNDYDLLLCVANWPTARRAHWRHLLLARAIENQACVVGVNRLGEDARGNHYSGDSLAIDAAGDILLDAEQKNGAASVDLDGATLTAYRESFPCYLDADRFQLD